jgi:tRNA dimethylallyltransferase
LLNELFKKHRVVLLVGGSMMYIDAVCNGLDDIPTVDEETRRYWQDIYREKGLSFIQEELKRFDPQHATEVDMQNYKRVLHALEICSMTGKPYSELRTGE